MKRFWLFACLFICSQNIFSQDQDTIIKYLEGKWEWYKSYKGGYGGGYIYPEDSGFNITIEFKALKHDSVEFYLYKDDTYIWDTVTTIFPVDTISLWGINKNVVPVLKRYFYISFPIQFLDYYGLLIEDKNHITFLEPSAEGPRHHFERKKINALKLIDIRPSIYIYPNPFDEQLYIEGLPNEQLIIEIYDLFGREFYRAVVNSVGSYSVTTGKINPGLYLIRVRSTDKGGGGTSKIIFKK